MIENIRSSCPSRRVGGGKSNVSGRYPSRKMGVSIQFESHRVELAGIYEMERDPDVLGYYDQPPTIKLDYDSPCGKRMGVLHTPDYFVIRQNEAGWEEWKTEEDLGRLSERNSNRYGRGSAGQWCCPPGITYAERLGLYYRVRSSSEIDWVFQRNIQFLDDYLRTGSSDGASARRDIAVACLTATPGLSLADLLQLTKDRMTPDDIYAMIAADVLYVDWRAAPLAEPYRVKVYATAEAMRQQQAGWTPELPPMVRLQCGSEMTWDGRLWRIVNVGDTSVSLLSADHTLTELPLTAFESLFRENRVRTDDDVCRSNGDSAIRDRLSKASEARSYAINGLGDLSRTWVEVLQMATLRTDLRFLSLLPFEDLFWPHAIFRRRRAWCARCYEDSRVGQRIVHEPLLWTLKAITFCPHYQRPLDEKCPRCCQSLKPFTVQSRPGYCSKCQQWLGHDDPSGNSQPAFPMTLKQHSGTREAGELLGAGPNVSRSLRNVFTANLQACVEAIAEGNKSAFAEAAKMSSRTIELLIYQRGLPTISTLLRISYNLKIPVMSLLHVERSSGVSYWQKARRLIQENRLPSARAAENIRVVLQRAASEQPPPRLSDVARRLNYFKLDRLYRVDAML